MRVFWLCWRADQPSSPQSALSPLDLIFFQIIRFYSRSTYFEKIVLGERSMDEWDTYVAEIEAMGLDELKAIHESSYARVLAAQQG